jgi:hypothetical protein
MSDADGPVIAGHVYAALCAREKFDPDDIPYALDDAVRELRRRGLPPERWATFIHMGA